jgi:N-acetylglucosaminyl-diphospho-decaprenol L-rhamnosyltransferase
MRQLAAVTVTYSPGETLETFLDSLELASAVAVPVVIADNGSTDGAPQRAAATHEDVVLLETGSNLGFGSAANIGVRATDAEWVLITNPDVVLAPGTLDALLGAAARWPRAGALGPLIRNTDGSVYPSARALPSLALGTGHALLSRVWPSNPASVAYRRSNESLSERTAGWLSGSCLMLRREAFDSVGGFDPGYFMYFEDVDLGDRLGKAGWLNVYVPTAEVTHLGGHSTRRNRALMINAHHVSAERYLARRYTGLRWAPVRMVLRVGLAGRAAAARVVVSLRSSRGPADPEQEQGNR